VVEQRVLSILPGVEGQLRRRLLQAAHAVFQCVDQGLYDDPILGEIPVETTTCKLDIVVVVVVVVVKGKEMKRLQKGAAIIDIYASYLQCNKGR